MQTLTPALEAILKSYFQAGADGYGSRFEIDILTASEFACDASLSTFDKLELNHQPVGTPNTMGVVTGDLDVTDDGLALAAIVLRENFPAQELTAGSGWTTIQSDISNAGHPVYLIMRRATTAGTVAVDATWDGGSGDSVWALAAASFRTSATDIVQEALIGPTDFATGITFDDPVTPGNMVVVILVTRDEPSEDPYADDPFYVGEGWTTIATAHTETVGGSPGGGDYIHMIAKCVDEATTGPFPAGSMDAHVFTTYAMEIVASGTEDSVFGPLSLTPKAVRIDKSLQMAADQANVDFPNEARVLGWGTGNVEQPSVFVANSRCRIYQGYGDPENYQQTFTGLVDKEVDSRDVMTTTIACRSMMAILLDQNFSSFAPQTPEQYQATIDAYNHGGAAPTPLDETPANGVYKDMEASDVVIDILNRAGWPLDARDITPTSYVFEGGYILTDGWSWAESIIGDERITGMTGYKLWDDEFGVIHFGPLPQTSLTDPQEAVYTFRTGEDIVSLSDSTDQYDRKTRVKVRGPLTNTTLKDTWTEVWRTSKIKHPVGIWYDPDQPEVIRVIDRGTKKMYRIRQSDRKVLGSFSIADICPHPLGLSGDPSDDSIYWLLSAPWIDGGSGGNKVIKVRRSDSHAIARYAIPDGRWSAIKVSGSYVYLTNLDTDKLYRRSKTDLSAINSWHHSYNGHSQTNPSGLMIDGTTISIFYSNDGTTARFLQVHESSPASVFNIVKTAGTSLHGGEMDTTTHTECYGDSDSLGLVAKFTLAVAVDHTREIYAEAIDIDLEDLLGTLAQSEDREHDAHPGDPDHPFEVRRETLDLPAITNLAQAAQTAQRVLDEKSKLRRVVDVGIIGNPALQKTDLVAQVDPIAGLSESAIIDTYRSSMTAGGTYLGTLSLIPAQVYTDEIEDPPTEDDPAEDDDDIDEVTDPDETDPEVVGGYYIAPDGDDSTGDGTIGDPWATIDKFVSVAAAGDTLYCRGGDYMDVARTIIGTGTGNPSGSAGNPITVMAYPTETPVFHGPGSDSYEQFLMFTDGVSYWTIDGLSVEDFKVGHAGAIYVGRNAGLMVPTHHIVVRNCTMTTVPEDAGPFNQLVYLSAYAEDCTVEDNILIGAGANDGCGVNIGDHEPSPLRSVVQRNVLINFGDAGAIWYNGDQNTGEIKHNTFIDCIRDISLRYYDTVTVRDNASTNASGISNVNDAGTGVATMDHNFGSQTFDGDYVLLPGNTGINAASTGDDAGAIDSGT